MKDCDWVIVRSKTTLNGLERDCVRVTVGPRVIDAVELDMADQWDFMELAGAQIDNQAWVNTALLASSVIAIDGTPLPSGSKTRDTIRQILRKVGPVGLDALQAAFADVADSEGESRRANQTASAVGN